MLLLHLLVATARAACTAGKYVNEGACTDCPSGKYTSGADEEACHVPRMGYYQPGTGQASQLKCPVGKFSTPTTGTAVPGQCSSSETSLAVTHELQAQDVTSGTSLNDRGLECAEHCHIYNSSATNPHSGWSRFWLPTPAPSPYLSPTPPTPPIIVYPQWASVRVGESETDCFCERAPDSCPRSSTGDDPTDWRSFPILVSSCTVCPVGQYGVPYTQMWDHTGDDECRGDETSLAGVTQPYDCLLYTSPSPRD